MIASIAAPRLRNTRALHPALRRDLHSDACEPPTREEEVATFAALRGHRLAAWEAVLSHPARSAAVLAGNLSGESAARLAASPEWARWSAASAEASGTGRSHPARARQVAAARALAHDAAGACDPDDGELRVCVRALADRPGRVGRSGPALAAAAALRALDDAVSTLVRRNLRLAALLARRAHEAMRGSESGAHFALDDLVSVAAEGLWQGVRRFDERKGFRLSTYATWWIRQALSRTTANLGRTIRLPVHVVEAMSKVGRVVASVAQSLGREPTDEEVAALASGLSVAKVASVRSGPATRLRPLSLHAPARRRGSGGSTTAWEDRDGPVLGDAIADGDEAACPESSAAAAERAALVDGLLDGLSPVAREIVMRRQEGETLQQIADDHALSRERIRQIENESYARLRRVLAERGVTCAAEVL